MGATERDAAPDEAHEIGYSKGHVVGHGEGWIEALLWASASLRETGTELKAEGSPDAAGYLDASTFLRAEAALREISEGGAPHNEVTS